jgi:hypothetical protein
MAIRRDDEDDDTPTPEELAEMAAIAAVPNAGFATRINGSGKKEVSTDLRTATRGTAAAIEALFKGKGGGPEAETMVLWNKEDAHTMGTVTFSSNRGRDVAALIKRLGDEGIHSFDLGRSVQDYATINVKQDRFRSVAHAFRASKIPVIFDPEKEFKQDAAAFRALRNAPGEPIGPLAAGQERWQVMQRPLPGLAGQLIEIYKGKGGGPDSESCFGWTKWEDFIHFSSCRGRDIAALVRRVGDDGIHSFKVPERFGWPICINVKAERFRTAAHAFKATRKAAGANEEDDDE